MTDKLMIDRSVLQQALDALVTISQDPDVGRASWDYAECGNACFALREALAAPQQNPWRVAVEEELVGAHILNETHSDPRKAVKDAIDWHVQVALDPAVSRAALDLIERGNKLAAPQPAQPAEPVAWIDVFGNVYSTKSITSEMQDGLAPLYPAQQPQRQPPVIDVSWLANVIREADGSNTLGAGALAEKIIEAIAALQPQLQRQPLTNCRQCGGPNDVLCVGQCKQTAHGIKGEAK